MNQKKIAVIVRERQSEALRMSIGLTILDDSIDVFLIQPLKDEANTVQELEGVLELGLKVYSLFLDERFNQITVEEMAKMLHRYDHIIPY